MDLKRTCNFFLFYDYYRCSTHTEQANFLFSRWWWWSLWSIIIFSLSAPHRSIGQLKYRTNWKKNYVKLNEIFTIFDVPNFPRSASKRVTIVNCDCCHDFSRHASEKKNRNIKREANYTTLHACANFYCSTKWHSTARAGSWSLSIASRRSALQIRRKR